ncbi:MAG TPA: tRNA uridine-5-carboxymethylaminomethyl(34) synthesis GTPase MnmE [Candidatus Binatia bacterium]|jgi:tRNA modification GTPase
MYKEDTIAAIATPPGEGGVAIVRLSGPDAERIVREIFTRSSKSNGALQSHRLYHGTIRDPRTDAVLDRVLLTIMRAPRSYTGEDVVEVHCHGGVFLVRRILGLVLRQGARHAAPGEFTMRAVLNGRIDLAQAEAVLDLIRARTDKSADLALRQSEGAISNWVSELREELLDILVQVEAAIDFPDEDIELLHRNELSEKIESLRQKISAVIDTYEWGRLFRDGARVCIWGRPNVGKSSLLNALLGEERVIVTPVPGTTRDVIEESMNLNGLPVVFSDTAGIRETDDEVERVGVEFSRRQLERADAVVLVLDRSAALTPEDLELIDLTRGKKRIVVINKSDLPAQLDSVSVRAETPEIPVLELSAKTGCGLEQLKLALNKLLIGCAGEPPIVLSNVRHKSALNRGLEALQHTLVALRSNQPPDLMAVDLNDAREALEEVIGKIRNDDILERIFSDFCIGK